MTQSFVIAQVRTITGTVIDSQTKETLPGATVILKGTTSGTSTDIDGKFSLSVSSIWNTNTKKFDLDN